MEPFVALWGRSRPVRDASADVRDDWPGPVGADATVGFGGRLLYGCVGAAAPRVLHVFDAESGARVAPPTALAADRGALAFAVTAQGLLAAGVGELVMVLAPGRWEAGLLDGTVLAALDGLAVPLRPLPAVELGRRDPGLGAEARTAEALQLTERLRALDPAAFAEGGSSLWADALSDLEAGL